MGITSKATFSIHLSILFLAVSSPKTEINAFETDTAHTSRRLPPKSVISQIWKLQGKGQALVLPVPGRSRQRVRGQRSLKQQLLTFPSCCMGRFDFLYRNGFLFWDRVSRTPGSHCSSWQPWTPEHCLFQCWNLCTYLFIFDVYEWFCLHVCLYSACMPGAQGDQKRASIPWNWSYRWLLATTWELGAPPRFSERIVNENRDWKDGLAPKNAFSWLSLHSHGGSQSVSKAPGHPSNVSSDPQQAPAFKWCPYLHLGTHSYTQT